MSKMIDHKEIEVMFLEFKVKGDLKEVLEKSETPNMVRKETKMGSSNT